MVCLLLGCSYIYMLNKKAKRNDVIYWAICLVGSTMRNESGFGIVCESSVYTLDRIRNCTSKCKGQIEIEQNHNVSMTALIARHQM